MNVESKEWQTFLMPFFEKDYFKGINQQLINLEANRIEFYPKTNQIFRAFELTNFTTLKVIIIGQDPYHGQGQADGLAFSVGGNQKIPPSLKNIFKELNLDLGFLIPEHGNLENWAAQGVLLLNSVLTVLPNKAGSHQKFGWQQLTDGVIKELSEKKKGLVFMLWGNYAQNKASLIDARKHLILRAPHPSPLSAYRGFFGCKHFSLANAYLVEQGAKPVDWKL